MPPAPGRPIYVEHEYARVGALAYLAAWDVHRARLFGRCERKNSIAAFHRLVRSWVGNRIGQRHVFLFADNGSCHRGQRAADRLRSRCPNIVLIHTPVHARWLNQIEVYFSIVQRKLLTPSDFQSLADLKRNVMAFQARYQRAAKPFKWSFTRRDLNALLHRLRKRRASARKLRQRNRHRNYESGYFMFAVSTSRHKNSLLVLQAVQHGRHWAKQEARS